jgi:cytochrome c-type biogenesis protein CcmF
VGPALPWGRATPAQVRRALLPPLVGAVLLTAVGVALGARRPWTLATLAFGGYALQVSLRELWLPLARRRAHGQSLGQALVGGGLLHGRRRFGSYVVHVGAALVIVAIAVSSTMGTQRETQLQLGETTEVGAYTLRFVAIDQESEPHRDAVVARVAVSRGGRELGVLSPRMNQYERQREPIGSPAVRSAVFEDLYLSVMNIDPQRGELGLLAMVNPMVGWIWGATVLMAIGSVIALVPARAARRP